VFVGALGTLVSTDVIARGEQFRRQCVRKRHYDPLVTEVSTDE
jgi:hypothetical protein